VADVDGLLAAIDCPHPGCQERALVHELAPAPCLTWTSFATGGRRWDDGDRDIPELLTMVEARCAEGHSFRCPAESLTGLGLA